MCESNTLNTSSCQVLVFAYTFGSRKFGIPKTSKNSVMFGAKVWFDPHDAFFFTNIKPVNEVYFPGESSFNMYVYKYKYICI
jgi:hypothetical protein